jgi:hypothetical protein
VVTAQANGKATASTEWHAQESETTRHTPVNAHARYLLRGHSVRCSQTSAGLGRPGGRARPFGLSPYEPYFLFDAAVVLAGLSCTEHASVNLLFAASTMYGCGGLC